MLLRKLCQNMFYKYPFNFKSDILQYKLIFFWLRIHAELAKLEHKFSYKQETSHPKFEISYFKK